MLCTIVGAGTGLGAALAERFAAGGFNVAMICRSPDRLAEWHERQDDPDRFALRAADASDEAALSAAFGSVERWRGSTDVLIYNVADLSPDPVEDLDASRLLATMEVNVGGALHSVRRVLPAMQRARRGTILITGGGLALEPYPDWASLSAGKAALRSITIGLYKQLLPQGIHVATVAVCGIIEPAGPFDPALIAEQYWKIHREPLTSASRELVYLPEGADPYYNDPGGTHRATSLPLGIPHESEFGQRRLYGLT